MATSEFIFNGISYEDDLVYIPVVTPVMKQLHLLFPTMFTPFVLKHQVIYLAVIIGVTIITLFIGKILGPVDSEADCESDILDLDFSEIIAGGVKKGKAGSSIAYEKIEKEEEGGDM